MPMKCLWKEGRKTQLSTLKISLQLAPFSLKSLSGQVFDPVALFLGAILDKHILKGQLLNWWCLILIFFFFWWGKRREKQIDMRKEKGTEKKGKNIISRIFWLSCWKMSSLQPALVSDLREKLWQRAGSSHRVYHGIQARNFLGRQMRWQEEAQEITCGWRGAHNVGLAMGTPGSQRLPCAKSITPVKEGMSLGHRSWPSGWTVPHPEVPSPKPCACLYRGFLLLLLQC